MDKAREVWNGWARITAAAEYAGVKPRTFRDWLKAGLKHSRMPSGLVLIKISDIDIFLESFTENKNRVDAIVSEVMEGLR
jgi:hypothetical protein